MKVEVTVPHEFQGMGISLLNKRKGQLTGSETGDMGVVIEADVPLSHMFGFSTDLRSGTQVRIRYLYYFCFVHRPCTVSRVLCFRARGSLQWSTRATCLFLEM